MAVAAAQAAEDGKRFESVDKQDFDTPHDEIRYLLADLKKQLVRARARRPARHARGRRGGALDLSADAAPPRPPARPDRATS